MPQAAVGRALGVLDLAHELGLEPVRVPRVERRHAVERALVARQLLEARSQRFEVALGEARPDPAHVAQAVAVGHAEQQRADRVGASARCRDASRAMTTSWVRCA